MEWGAACEDEAEIGVKDLRAEEHRIFPSKHREQGQDQEGFLHWGPGLPGRVLRVWGGPQESA